MKIIFLNNLNAVILLTLKRLCILLYLYDCMKYIYFMNYLFRIMMRNLFGKVETKKFEGFNKIGSK